MSKDTEAFIIVVIMLGAVVVCQLLAYFVVGN